MVSADGLPSSDGTIQISSAANGNVRVIEARSLKPSEALAIHRVALRQLLNRHGFWHPRVFGSVLTKTDTEESDLDLLVESRPGMTLFMFVGVEEEAQRLMGVRVSILTAEFLPPKFREEVLRQAEPL